MEILKIKINIQLFVIQSKFKQIWFQNHSYKLPWN